MRKDVFIIGGGASGIVCAIMLARRGKSVAIIEKNERIGKKLLATGNGKCNLMAASCDITKYNTSAVKTVFDECGVAEIKKFCESIGLLLREENGRIYPYSEQATTVLNALRQELSSLNVVEICGYQVTNIDKKEDFILNNDVNMRAKNIVFATGSAAGFGTDSLGLLAKFGHTINDNYPSLAPILTDTTYIKGLKGVRAKLNAKLYINNHLEGECLDEVIFKDNGLSGTAIFNLSTIIARHKDSGERQIVLDFIPEMSESELCKFLAERAKFGRELDGIFHKEIAQNILKRCEKTQDNSENLAHIIKNYDIIVKGLSSPTLAQVMSGGVSVDEVNFATMQSLIVGGMYITGEALDVDGECGGYNLMWAIASGIIAGSTI